MSAPNATAGLIRLLAEERVLAWCALASLALHALVLLGMSAQVAPPPKTQIVLSATLAPTQVAPPEPAKPKPPPPPEPAKPKPPPPEPAKPKPPPPPPPPEPVTVPPLRPAPPEPVAVPPPRPAPPAPSQAPEMPRAAPAAPVEAPHPEPAPAAPSVEASPPPAATIQAAPAPSAPPSDFVIAIPTPVSPPPASVQPAPAPAPAAPPSAPPAIEATKSATGVDAGGLEDYRLALIVATRRYKRYPAIALEKGWQGRVDVRMVIDANGVIASTAIKTGSGHEVLDKQALDMLNKGKTTVPIPASLRGREFVIDVPVIFNLENPNS